MSDRVTLTCTGAQYAAIRTHLFPGDGKEAAAILLCGHGVSQRKHRLLVHEIYSIPYEICRVRTSVQLVWPVEWMDPLVARASTLGLSIVKVHSHPTGFDDFSAADDASDKALFPGIHAWLDRPLPHASVVMLPDGEMFGRTVDDTGEFEALQSIAVVGDDLYFWHADKCPSGTTNVGRPTMAFGHAMRGELGELSVAIVGCSGTGSIVAEQLARLGVGRLVLVDPKEVTRKNLDRILNAMGRDADQHRPKVAMLADAIETMQLGTEVEALHLSLLDRSAITAVAGCDVVFGCVDSVEGRHILNRIATYYLLPYIDIGVGLVATQEGNIDQVNGVVHYLQPGGSSLLSRGAYRPEQLAAEEMQRTSLEEYKKRLRERYIEGAGEEQPAVISVNMAVASFGVNELLARLYRFRNTRNGAFAVIRINLTEMEIEGEEDGRPCRVLVSKVGLGDCQPPLGVVGLADETKS